MKKVWDSCYHENIQVSRKRALMQFGKVARASRPLNHAQDARATIKLHQYQEKHARKE